MPVTLKNLSDKVSILFREFDRMAHDFQMASGLYCPENCGACCQSETVEATLLECLPMAFTILDRDDMESCLNQLASTPLPGLCLLFIGNHAEQGTWGCSCYADRPLVCRLFGFAGSRGKDGQLQLAFCRVMRETGQNLPDVAGDARLAAVMPIITEAAIQLTTLHPDYGTRRQPINEAMRAAVMKVGMYLQMSCSEQLSPSTKPSSEG